MWWTLLVVFGFLVLVIIYLLFARLVIDLDSDVNIYKLSFGRLMSGRIVWEMDSIWIKLIILGWRKDINVLKPSKPRTKVPAKKPTKKVNRGKFTSPSFKKIFGVINSFRLKKCNISIDTGNMPLNGILYPLFYMLSNKINKKIGINFWGENLLIVRIENTLARMLWAYFKS